MCKHITDHLDTTHFRHNGLEHAVPVTLQCERDNNVIEYTYTMTGKASLGTSPTMFSESSGRRTKEIQSSHLQNRELTNHD